MRVPPSLPAATRYNRKGRTHSGTNRTGCPVWRRRWQGFEGTYWEGVKEGMMGGSEGKEVNGGEVRRE